jgi:5-(carboxyamino)imidazole ribonucleotide synthase
MKKTFQDELKIGIIKGGQLGRMLIQEMLNWNLKSFVLDNDVDAPCRECCTEFMQGDAENFDDVYHFGKKVDLLTIEYEHIHIGALEKLEQEGLAVLPSPRILKIIQDKGLQKKFYQENDIPTADFVLIENKNELTSHSNFLPAVQKTRKSGYDGKGVQKITSEADFARAFDEPSVLERKIDFEKEISVLIARNASGQTATFPIVELDFHPEKNLVEFLHAPADLSKSTEEEALKIVQKLAESLNLVGLLAVEMFVLKDGKVLVNEIAPRPHNSGHHTIEANYTSQYEQHLRAILNLPLGSTKMIMPACMVNLLGEEGYEGPARYAGMEKVLEMEGVFVHLYGKKMTKPFRKMGHVTILAENIEKAREKAILVKNTLKVSA